MLARSAGIPVKCIAAGYQQHPFTYFSLAKDPIRTPKDMIGKTIATQPTAKILLKALLAKNGIAASDVKVVNMGGDMNQLLTGQASAVTGWLTNANALKILGPDRVDMKLWDAGIQLYANPIMSRTKPWRSILMSWSVLSALPPRAGVTPRKTRKRPSTCWLEPIRV